MKKILPIIAFLLCFAGAMAQPRGGHGGFSPEKFQADLEGFITRDAGLSPKEAAAVFPIYRELGEKQRHLMDKMRRASQVDPCNEAACAKSIRDCDKLDVDMKKLQQNYHAKMVQATSAQKVWRILQAEMKFHRRALRAFGDKRKGK